VIQLNTKRYWLYAAVDPETNELLHTKLKPTTTGSDRSVSHGISQSEHYRTTDSYN
jgi:transposase-like protein